MLSNWILLEQQILSRDKLDEIRSVLRLGVGLRGTDGVGAGVSSESVEYGVRGQVRGHGLSPGDEAEDVDRLLLEEYFELVELSVGHLRHMYRSEATQEEIDFKPAPLLGPVDHPLPPYGIPIGGRQRALQLEVLLPQQPVLGLDLH